MQLLQVKPSQLLNPENITSFLTDNDSLFNQVLKDGDLNKAAQIANTLLQAISQDSTLSSAEKIKVMDFKETIYLLITFIHISCQVTTYQNEHAS